MSNQPKDTNEPADQPEKLKKPDTVQLSADELRAISGGGMVTSGTGSPGVQPADKVVTPKIKP